MADDQNKTEKATPFKLEEAKKKGQVAKSTEVSSFFMLSAFSIVMVFTGSQLWAGLKHQMTVMILNAGEVKLSANSLTHITFDTAEKMLGLFTPIIIVLMVGAMLVNIVQTGPVLSSHPITPDFKRLNPAAGIKKLISIKTVFELFKALFKVLLIVMVWTFLADFWLDKLMAGYGMGENEFMSYWASLATILSMLILGVLIPHALIDFIFS